uniref:Uncharacterized protein n=1 Tax=Lepeophtheirus salmonis TaxID=72036 RepID=A0A0K2TLE2_LEPSM
MISNETHITRAGHLDSIPDVKDLQLDLSTQSIKDS